MFNMLDSMLLTHNILLITFYFAPESPITNCSLIISPQQLSVLKVKPQNPTQVHKIYLWLHEMERERQHLQSCCQLL